MVQLVSGNKLSRRRTVIHVLSQYLRLAAAAAARRTTANASSVTLPADVGSRHGTGSLGHRVNGPFGSSFTSGSPGHHFDPV